MWIILIAVWKILECLLKWNWEVAGNFVCAQYGTNPNLQEFNINKETQFVKIEFIDNWGIRSGNFILIKVLCFEIGDIL